MKTRKTLAAALAASAIFQCAITASARADCYDLLGCDSRDMFSRHFDYLASPTEGPTCDYLYVMRNRIYQEHGYCFSSAHGVSALGNQGCTITDQSAVPLSDIERANISTILNAERVKGCVP